MKLALDATTTIHLNAAQLRQARFYAWLHGVSLAQAVAELTKRERARKNEKRRIEQWLKR